MNTKEIISNYTNKEFPNSIGKIGMMFLIIGALLTAIAFFVDPERATYASLIGFMFLISIGMGAMFFIAVEYISDVVWSVPFRRITEYMTNLLWIAPLFAIPTIINILSHGHMYHWVHPGNDVILLAKSSYLNEGWFIIRTVGVLGVVFLFKLYMVSNSKKQDDDNDQKYTKRNVIASAPFLAVFAIGITIIAIDYMMSLEPHWFSTIYGVYYFAGTFCATVAVLTLFSVTLNEKGLLIDGINSDHYYSMGGYMFAFTAFWMYIAFSQYMLIWYANMPEETFWFIPRLEGIWGYATFTLLIVKFIVPFGLLINRQSKIEPKRLKFSAYWILAAHFYDLYWLIYPTYSKQIEHHGHHFSSLNFWMEIGIAVFVIGIIMTVVKASAKNSNLVPIGDPKLERALNFHI